MWVDNINTGVAGHSGWTIKRKGLHNTVGGQYKEKGGRTQLDTIGGQYKKRGTRTQSDTMGGKYKERRWQDTARHSGWKI